MFEIVQTNSSTGRFSDHANGRQQKCNKNADDGDDHEHFDKRKASTTGRMGASRHRRPLRELPSCSGDESEELANLSYSFSTLDCKLKSTLRFSPSAIVAVKVLFVL
jgi:hypothetical protein